MVRRGHAEDKVFAEEYKTRSPYEAITKAHYVNNFIDCLVDVKEAIEMAIKVREIHVSKDS